MLPVLHPASCKVKMPTCVQDLVSDEAYAAGKDQLLPATSKAVFVDVLRPLNIATGELLK